MDKHMYDDSGFTLIEVVFTISIILILSTITLHFVINSKPVISLQQQCQQVISLLEEGKSRAMINHEQINIVIQTKQISYNGQKDQRTLTINDNYYIDDYYVALKVVFVGLMLLMPCSILINKLLQDIYPESEEMGIFDIGSMIGIMERILTVIFAYFDNFPAVAIIITIKTWARTNDLKESEFRNKYLLGTLTSMVLALVIFIIYKLL